MDFHTEKCKLMRKNVYFWFNFRPLPNQQFLFDSFDFFSKMTADSALFLWAKLPVAFCYRMTLLSIAFRNTDCQFYFHYNHIVWQSESTQGVVSASMSPSVSSSWVSTLDHSDQQSLLIKQSATVPIVSSYLYNCYCRCFRWINWNLVLPVIAESLRAILLLVFM